MAKTRKPYGEWESPITADLITSQIIGLGGPRSHNGELFWDESRPQEGGRTVVVRRAASGIETDLIPTGFNARSRVHEYGGGAWLLHEDQLCFVNFADQQLYAANLAGGEPTPLTDTPHLRFANAIADPRRNRLILVVEDHGDKDAEPTNYLGAVDLKTGAVTTLHRGHDFYSSPTVSPDGGEIAWMTWDHPDMPWDAAQIHRANLGDDGSLVEETVVAGGAGVSAQQPRYSPAGELHFISDESGWWNIYQLRDGAATNLCPMEAEFGSPHWVFGLSSYQFRGDAIICRYETAGDNHLATLDEGSLTEVPLPYCHLGEIHLDGDVLLCTGASPTCLPEIARLDLASGEREVVKSSGNLDMDAAYISTGEAIAFETADGDTAHGFHYAPANAECEAPPDETPPLIVILHGGPTSSTSRALSLRTQYWTSRGFALLDVNYRGSTGYGRAYRDKLRNAWGIADVADTVHGATHLVEQGKADPKRLAIRGGSAGGYTTLAALAFTDTFTAGASLYGIADLEALARDTHKFEARYLDSLIGPYPDGKDIYVARSPIHHVDGLAAPIIFFQGLEDQIVPPNQAEAMVAALTAKGIPVAYVPFEGEQHGFRRAENIKRCLTLELHFYGRVFGFTPTGDAPDLDIINLD